MLFIIVCALVLAVLACVGVVLLTLRVAAHTRGLDSMIRLHTKLDAIVHKSSPATVQAALDDMRAALAMMAESNHRQFGSINRRMRKAGAQDEPDAPAPPFPFVHTANGHVDEAMLPLPHFSEHE